MVGVWPRCPFDEPFRNKEVHIPSPLRVASVPSNHVYVRHLASPAGPGEVVRLPDPDVQGAPAGQWWPSPVLEPAWLHEHVDSYDLVHVHFGFEHRTAAQLVEFAAVLRHLGRPLVLTVHDLANPHVVDQRRHLESLGVLVPAAAAVVTLTTGAAREIRRRWGRRAAVLAHPHVVPLDRLADARPAHTGFVVGLHTKRRAGNDPEAVRHELGDAVAGLDGARLHPGHERRLTDHELWDHLAGLDALVLPYRSGTHSGFVEACYDLGTTVVAARVGFLAEQQALLSFDLDQPGSLSAALRLAYDQRPAWRADPGVRAEQRRQLAVAHADLYTAAVQNRAAA